jgi:uncharacterized protein YbaP (TraB family)
MNTTDLKGTRTTIDNGKGVRMNRLRCGVVLLIALIATASAADETVLEEVLITGEQPGPGLWQASKMTPDGEHTVWLLGTLSPLPKNMVWRSRKVESILAESQRVIAWVKFDVDIKANPFSVIGSMPSMLNADKNPDGAKLQEVLPPDVYANWLVLKARYLGANENVERMRPTWAWYNLDLAARRKSGLTFDATIESAVEEMAKQRRVKIERPEVEMKVKIAKPRGILKKYKETPLSDTECFADSIARLEGKIDALQARAIAWAVGDLATLRSTSIDTTKDCKQIFDEAVSSGQLADEVGARELYEENKREGERAFLAGIDKWLKAVDKAVATHKSTLALAPLDSLMFEDGGLVAALRARGYEVKLPQ